MKTNTMNGLALLLLSVFALGACDSDEKKTSKKADPTTVYLETRQKEKQAAIDEYNEANGITKEMIAAQEALINQAIDDWNSGSVEFTDIGRKYDEIKIETVLGWAATDARSIALVNFFHGEPNCDIGCEASGLYNDWSNTERPFLSGEVDDETGEEPYDYKEYLRRLEILLVQATADLKTLLEEDDFEKAFGRLGDKNLFTNLNADPSFPIYPADERGYIPNAYDLIPEFIFLKNALPEGVN